MAESSKVQGGGQPPESADAEQRNTSTTAHVSGDHGSTPTPDSPPSGAESEVELSRYGLRSLYLTLSSRPLGLYEIPYHPDFGPEHETRNRHPELLPFLKRILEEGEAIDVAQEEAGWKKTGTHTFNSKSIAQGVTVTHISRKDEQRHEVWAARHSIHDESEEHGEGVGKITWETFDSILRDQHSRHEAEYTPNIYDCTELLRWPTTGHDGLEPLEKSLGFKDVGLWIVNMYHGIPFPLKDRIFSVLVAVGVRTDLPSTNKNGASGVDKEFLVVQLPVDITSLPDVVKNRSHHRVPGSPTYQRDPDRADAKQKGKLGKAMVYGQYASVEKVSRVRSGETWENHWKMALISDAKGVLPLWVQRRAVPGEIIKDIEYVFEYAGKGRGG